jgi:hypothetical protein
MSDKIYNIEKGIPLDKISLYQPTNISSGIFFCKSAISQTPIYLQTPACTTKQGIVSGKRNYCDLIFSHDNEEFIQILENLEIRFHELLFQNREKWFETPLDMNDIETSFTSPLKSYKSGKFYIVRVNIPMRLGTSILTIYDEDENVISPETIDENTNMIVILEIQGVKCSPKNFQIELEVKQMMVMKPVNLFEKCIIKNKVTESKEPKTEPEPEPEPETETTREEKNQNETIEQSNKDSENTPVSTEESSVSNIPINESTLENELCEINLDIDTITETDTVQLKKRNDVYYEMYREARRKAKIAKNLALSSYLEARRIKNTYMLTDIESDDNSESDLDIEEGEETDNKISSI